MIETKEMIRQLIKVLGSKEDVAVQLHVSWATINSWTTGARSPRPRMIEQIKKLHQRTMSRIAEKLGAKK